MASAPQQVIKPQAGPQEAFLSSSADIVIYGGAAGGGKTYAELIEPLRHVTSVPGFGAVIFRRTYPEITTEGSLWDTSMKIYPLLGGVSREGDLDWTFRPYGNTISFSHLEHDKDVHKYQGSQICLICFDELTTFTAYQFWYLLSRNRSTCGVKPYIRATCNPDPDSWVKDLIRWWLDADGRYPDPEKAGRLRWFIRLNDKLLWADTPEELKEKYGPDAMPKSLTFIPAKLSDNRILCDTDPGYEANLKALGLVEQERLLRGDWLIRPMAGTVFRREWFEVVDAVPKHFTSMVRYWDLAATEPHSGNPDPDYTVGLLYAKDEKGTYYVLDVVRDRRNPGGVQDLVKSTAQTDGPGVQVGMEQEPGSAGKTTIDAYARALSGYTFYGNKPTGDKVTRARTASAAAMHGLIKLKRAPWNLDFITEAVSFPAVEGKGHDDQVDALSGAHERLALGVNQNIAVASGTRKW
jgi:predicted phage terminase large subunit-like protein